MHEIKPDDLGNAPSGTPGRPNAPLIETLPTPGSFKRSWGRTYLNVKQLLDKERGTHRYLDVFSVAWDQKKKIQRVGASREETFQKSGNRRHGGGSYRSDTQWRSLPSEEEDGAAFSLNNRSGTFWRHCLISLRLRRYWNHRKVQHRQRADKAIVIII